MFRNTFHSQHTIPAGMSVYTSSHQHHYLPPPPLPLLQCHYPTSTDKLPVLSCSASSHTSYSHILGSLVFTSASAPLSTSAASLSTTSATLHSLLSHTHTHAHTHARTHTQGKPSKSYYICNIRVRKRRLQAAAIIVTSRLMTSQPSPVL